MYVHTYIGTFPCKFDENFAKLKNGANHFELEMYSIIDNKRYVTQKIPDIHHFNQYIHDDYYNGNNNIEKKKFFFTSLFTIFMANIIHKNPQNILNNLKYLTKFIGPQILSSINFIENFSKNYVTVIFGGGRLFFENLKFFGGFLFEIYKAGLASPIGMYIYSLIYEYMYTCVCKSQINAYTYTCM
jgi:hypothetical protein